MKETKCRASDYRSARTHPHTHTQQEEDEDCDEAKKGTERNKRKARQHRNVISLHFASNSSFFLTFYLVVVLYCYCSPIPLVCGLNLLINDCDKLALFCECVCLSAPFQSPFLFLLIIEQDRTGRQRERENDLSSLPFGVVAHRKQIDNDVSFDAHRSLTLSCLFFFLQHSYSICYRVGVHTQTHRQRPKQNKREKERRHVSNTVSSTEGEGGGRSDERQTHVRLGLNHVKRN